MTEQTPTELSDGKALDLIRSEMSSVMWTPDTLDVVASYVRRTGREILGPGEDEPQFIDDAAPVTPTVEVWSLTVHAAQCAIVTTVHASEAAARECLFANYDQFDNYDRDDLQALIDGECLVVYIESHKLVLP